MQAKQPTTVAIGNICQLHAVCDTVNPIFCCNLGSNETKVNSYCSPGITICAGNGNWIVIIGACGVVVIPHCNELAAHIANIIPVNILSIWSTLHVVGAGHLGAFKGVVGPTQAVAVLICPVTIFPHNVDNTSTTHGQVVEVGLVHASPLFIVCAGGPVEAIITYLDDAAPWRTQVVICAVYAHKHILSSALTCCICCHISKTIPGCDTVTNLHLLGVKLNAWFALCQHWVCASPIGCKVSSQLYLSGHVCNLRFRLFIVVDCFKFAK